VHASLNQPGSQNRAVAAQLTDERSKKSPVHTNPDLADTQRYLHSNVGEGRLDTELVLLRPMGVRAMPDRRIFRVDLCTLARNS
jgi:hypothetical protein